MSTAQSSTTQFPMKVTTGMLWSLMNRALRTYLHYKGMNKNDGMHIEVS
jgi:hypothetical protein